MNTQNLLLQANNVSRITGLTVQGHKSILKEGSSVFVKIIADKGNGVYEGSVAGHRVHINSSKGLEVGSSFVASISSKNGTIYITPKDNVSTSFNNQYIQINTVEGNTLATLLSNLGVHVNQLSGNILKMMMMNDMKIDSELLRNIFIKASKMKGKEKLSGEILILIKNKGIEATQEEIETLLGYLEENKEREDYTSSSDYDKEKELINKINKDDKGWTLVPFNLVDMEDNVILGNGVIRLLLNKFSELKKINLNCFYNSKEYLFSLFFEGKKIREVLFNINPLNKNEEYYTEKVKTILSKYNSDIRVEFTSPSLLEGCGSEGEKIYSFDGEA